MVTSDQLFEFVKETSEKAEVDFGGFVELGDGLTAVAKLAEAELFLAAQERHEKQLRADAKAERDRLHASLRGAGGPLAN